MNVRILLADDHEIVRYGLQMVLDRVGGFEIVGEACDGRQAVELTKKLRPHVVIMDIGMPLLNGIGATREIRRIDPNVRVVVLTMHCNRTFLVNMLELGVSGYVLKDQANSDLVQAIRTALAGEVFLSPRVAALVAEDYLRRQSPEPSRASGLLTPRESEILQLIAEGHSTKHIAAQLHVSIKTVESTRRQIMKKLDVHTIAGLTKYAISRGLTTLEF